MDTMQELMATHLKKEDTATVVAAREFARRKMPPPDGPATHVALFLSDNQSLQDRLAYLRGGLKHHFDTTYHQMKVRESLVRGDLKEDKWNAADERSSMCHADPAWSDMHLTVKSLETLMEYLSSLEWNLRSSSKYYSKGK